MKRLWPIVVGVAGVLVLLWLVVVAAPPWFVEDESTEGLRVQNEVRTTLLQGLAGLALLVGVYFTWRQLHIAREGQITERYTRAIDQLGHSTLDVRLGGIYALERIARDSPGDRLTIGEVLTAFVRGRSPWRSSLLGGHAASAPVDEVSELEARAPDVQATLTVIGRGGFTPPKRLAERLDLNGVDLRRASLHHAKLEAANLHGAHLDGANLFSANLEGADLSDAHLVEANLIRVNLKGASLDDAHMEGADLRSADLKGASLSRAHLDGADLRDARLREAFSVQFANLHSVTADGRTQWPDGFDWSAAGVTVKGIPTGSPYWRHRR